MLFYIPCRSLFVFIRFQRSVSTYIRHTLCEGSVFVRMCPSLVSCLTVSYPGHRCLLSIRFLTVLLVCLPRCPLFLASRIIFSSSRASHAQTSQNFDTYSIRPGRMSPLLHLSCGLFFVVQVHDIRPGYIFSLFPSLPPPPPSLCVLCCVLFCFLHHTKYLVFSRRTQSARFQA